MMPTAVLFDLDGTLVDTAPDFIVTLQALCKRKGVSCKSDAEIRAAVSNGGSAMVQLCFNLTPDTPSFTHMLDEFLNLYANYAGKNSTLFDEVLPCLDFLERHAIPWGIVTNKPRRYTEILLARMRLTERCASVVCPDDVTHRKPHPEALFLACKELNVSAKTCIYVGDHRRDIDAGKAAGMTTIGCRWGYFDSLQEPDSWGADIVVGTAAELLTFIQRSESK